MNWYKRHIGDYAKKTRRLSILEHGSYTLLLDSCYDRERFPKSVDEAIEWVWARSQDEIESVKFVLSRFFSLENGFYVETDCAKELRSYAGKSETNTRIAQEREAKRKEAARIVHESSPVVHEPPPNQEPRTKNQEPRTKNQEPRTKNQEPIKKKGEPKSEITFAEWIEKNPSAEFKAACEYCDSIGVPQELSSVAFFEFEQKYTTTDASKKYKCWELVLLKAIKENWLKIWYKSPSGDYQLTTRGQQAQTAMLASAVQS